MLSLQHLTVVAAGKTILHDVSYTFEKGKIYVVMGPNGSGKSTLAHTVMGNPQYTLHKKGRIQLDRKRIDTLSPDKRSSKGLFLSFQTPLALRGVTVFQLLRAALEGKRDPLELRRAIDKEAKRLHIRPDVLERNLNDGASGGEQKKLEVLQASILNPAVAIFDEVDTGVDVDALKVISRYLDSMKEGKTLIFITHYSRLLKYLNPDVVLVMKEGRIRKEGGKSLLHNIEENGYEDI